MSVNVKRPVKINMIKINLSAAAEGGRRKRSRVVESGFQNMIIVPASRYELRRDLRS
jgi:hypothetical protein